MENQKECMFYVDGGVYSPVPETAVREFSRSLGLYSDQRGMASVLFDQMWAEIDSLRNQVAFLEAKNG